MKRVLKLFKTESLSKTDTVQIATFHDGDVALDAMLELNKKYPFEIYWLEEEIAYGDEDDVLGAILDGSLR